MSKIMFNERYGLQQAVLARLKTMTRRVVKCPKKFRGVEDVQLEFHKRLDQDFYYDCVVVDADGHELGQLPLPYEIGDVVAIAQPYKDVINPLDWVNTKIYKDEKGWTNKMYVRADMMPHHIRITDLWFERLRDIRDEDCLKEGIRQSIVEYGEKKIVQWTYFREDITIWYDSPRDAFAAMIERICGSGTWAENPWVIAYTFELID